MFYKEHGFTQGFFTVLNRCVTAPFFTVTQETGHEKNRPVFELAPRTPRNIAQERYLAIPTFIRQGKTLGL